MKILFVEPEYQGHHVALHLNLLINEFYKRKWQINILTYKKSASSEAYKLIDKKILDVLPEDVSINIYYPGNKMVPHIDKIDAGPVITILSLLSDTNLILSYGSKKEIVSLPSRSVVQLKDKYRTHWKHSIEKVKDKRISIVFRQLGKK